VVSGEDQPDGEPLQQVREQGIVAALRRVLKGS
jgi:hypothetical protein